MKKVIQVLLAFTAIFLLHVENIYGATKTWTGSGAGGIGTDFNDGANWSGGIAPAPADDVIIPVSFVGVVYVTGNITVHSLQINFTSAVAGAFGFTVTTGKNFTVSGDVTITNESGLSLASQFQLSVGSSAQFTCFNFNSNCNASLATAQNYLINQGNFKINGDLTINATSFIASTKTYFINYDNLTVNGNTTTAVSGNYNTFFVGAEDGSVTNFNGNVSLAGTASKDSIGIAGKGLLGMRSNSTGQVIFRGDLTLGNYVWNVRVGSSSNYTLPKVFIFDRATGSQTITNNAGSQIYFPSLQVGISNSPEVILSAASLKKIRIYSGDITINNTSILDLTTDSLNRSSAGGNLILNGTTTLKLGASKGGQDGSNFPKNFSAISLNAASTVEYNGASLDQTIYATGSTPSFSYGNLKLSNGGTKTVGSACPSINGTVYITGSSTIVDDGGHTFGQSSTNLTQDGGRLILRGTGTKPNMAGTFTITGGVVEFANVNLTAQTIRKGNYLNIEVTGTKVGNSNGNISLNSNGSFTVKSGGLFSINDNTITCSSGNGKVIVENNAVFQTGNDQGFCGFSASFTSNSAIDSNITNISLATGSTVEYTRASTQVFSARDDYSNVTISGGSKKIMNGDVTINGILSNSTGNQLVLNDFTLSENNTITGAGTLTGSRKSGLIFGDHATAGDLKFTENDFTKSPPDSVNNYLDTLILLSSADVTLGDSLNITASDGTEPIPVSDNFGKTRGALRVDAGATLQAQDKLTLRSDEYGDAYLAASYGVISGTVRYDRFFYAKRAWRFIAVPFSSSGQSINAAWQEGNVDGTPNSCPVNIGTPGFGTAITYNNDASIGYDWHDNDYKTSIEVYQNNAWAPLPSGQGTLNTNLCDYPAYCLFVRGDRTICLTTINPPNKTTLRSKGILHENGLVAQNAATENFTTSAGTDQFVLIGNPFPAPVKFTRTGIYSGLNTNTFYFFDPGLTGKNGVGGYTTYSAALGGWLTSGGGVYTGTEQPYVQSGQAFMMLTDGVSVNPSATFLQSDKGDYQFNVSGPESFSKKDTAHKKPALYVYLQSVTDSMAVTDAVAIAVNKKYSKTLDGYDAPKLWNEGENMAIKNDTNFFMVDARPAPGLTDTAFLKIYLYNNRQYALKIFAVKAPYNIYGNLWLVDNYLGIKTKIDQQDTLVYDFTPNSDTNSYRNRFMIVYNRLLPTIPVAASKMDTTQAGDISPAAAEGEDKLAIFPNPVKDVLHIQNIDKGAIINVYDAKGRLLLTQQPNKATDIIHCKNFADGVYMLTAGAPGSTLK